MNRYFKHIVVLSLLSIVLASCKAQKSTTADSRTSDQTTDTIVQSEEPIGFTSHRVRKRETLYGIAKRFKITEDEIKKYNPELYAAQLRKNMTLKIPKYRRTKVEAVTGSEEDFETYTVAPKETRWSIANKYGITIDSMLVLNPELSKASDYLAVGQELKMPRLPGSTVENQETQLYLSYNVPPKMNFYQLEQKFGVKSEEIVRLNPEIVEKGGLKEGMTIRIPQKKLEAGEINTDNYNFYEVKPKQTVFSLTRKLGIAYKDLLELNPDLQDGLEAGMVLKLPKDQEGDFEVRNSLILDKINLVDSINVQNRPKILFLLPFRLDKLNLEDKEEVADIIEDRNSLKYSLGLYSGALVALDSIADLGLSVDVKTYDNQLDLSRTKQILQKENLDSFSAIVGPLDLASLKETAVRAKDHQVPLIAPIPAESDLSLSNVFYSYTSDEVLRERLLDFAQEKYEDQNVVVIADSLHIAAKDSILSRFPDAKVTEVIEEEKNIGINIDSLKSRLSDEVENWVFVETNNYKLLASVSSILNSLQNSLLNIEEPDRDRLKIKMFTTKKGTGFENDVISSVHLSNLHFTYPSVYRMPESSTFSRRYEKRFGTLPDRYAVRGFDLTFDLLLKLAYKNNLMQVSKFIGETEYSGNKFDYRIDPAKGYFNQASYIMTFEDLTIKEVQ
ncbi:MAG TPA: LysM peptidoglycan-binding domain-containing protein [Pricia sp.]|nr:LysM peptidoglycan-binding domain-containing protein [Pricia sp.]